jgi:pilus assembly protein Flp/PilA
MNHMLSKLSRFIRDEEGLELSEYAVAGSLIVLGTVLAFTALGDAITAAIDAITAAITGNP